jgi:hypothetical protein
MPTDKPRHMITEDDAVHAAAQRWPDIKDRPSELLQRLIGEGHRALRESAEARHAAVEATVGAGTCTYGENYLAELREEWPT